MKGPLLFEDLSIRRMYLTDYFVELMFIQEF